MIKKLKTALLSIMATALFVTPLMLATASATAAADVPSIGGGLCQGVNLKATDDNGSGCTVDQGGTATSRVNDIIALVINIFSLIVGVVSVIMIIIGGLRYIISGGESGNVTSAKNTIMYAIIGLVVVALAQFIVKFVLNKVNNAGTA